MMDRYQKQRIFLGRDADARLRERRVAIVGLGATGSVLATWMVRAGVGEVTLLDRDVVDLTNLHRQILYTEHDLGRPKAQAAAAHLGAVNSGLRLNPLATDLTSGNAREILAGHDLILDGTDNFEARYLINDVSILTGTPWIYTGVIGGEGIVWPIAPPATPCLRCLMAQPPAGGDVDTCDSAGVLGPGVGIVASWAAMEALKILSGSGEPQRELARFDFWHNERQFVRPPKVRCPYCSRGLTEFLDARWSIQASSLCGLEGVQIRVNPPGNLHLKTLQKRLEQRTGTPWKCTPLTLAGHEGAVEVILFKDGRALFHGAITPERARSWYSEVVGC